MPPSDEGGGKIVDFDGGRDMIEYNKNNISLARNMRKNPTPWERKLWYEFLRAYPIRFQRQKAIGNYIVDFYCAKARLVIELDGGGHFSKEQLDYDNSRSKELQSRGLKVLRFSNLEIDRHFYEVCETIDREVRNLSLWHTGRVTSPSSEGDN